MIGDLLGALFARDRNVIAETVEVFRPNAEAQAGRNAAYDSAALAQLAAEFQARGQRGWFDRLMDGVNRVPRPAIVLGLLGLLVWTPINPDGAIKVFAAWSALPAGYWTIMAIVVTFYFGGRHQAKTHALAKDLAAMTARAAVGGVAELESDVGQADAGTDARASLEATEPSENPALDDIMGR